MGLTAIDRDVRKQFDELAEELTEEMYQGYLKTGKLVFNEKKYLERTTDITIDGMIRSTELGLSGSGLVLVSHNVVSDYYLGITYKGSTLSSRLRKNAKQAEKIVTETLNNHIKAGTNWKDLAKAFDSQIVSKDTLPKYLTELNKAAKEVLTNQYSTKAQKRELDRLLRQAKNNVQKLSKGGAPTKQLKSSYNRVIKAVEKGDLPALEEKMSAAMRRKALYNNEMLARTEMANADTRAFDRALEESPHIEMVKILLDERHNVIDECDFITQADLYGRGKGVYPKDRYPRKPFHTGCLCDQITVSVKLNGARFSNERAEEYFSKLPKAKRKSMLQGGFIKDWKKDLKGYEGELNDKPKPLPKRLVKSKK